MKEKRKWAYFWLASLAVAFLWLCMAERVVWWIYVPVGMLVIFYGHGCAFLFQKASQLEAENLRCVEVE